MYGEISLCIKFTIHLPYDQSYFLFFWMKFTDKEISNEDKEDNPLTIN